MKTIQVGKLKHEFSAIIEEVREGEEFIIAYGRKMEKVAVIIPYERYLKNNKRKLGELKKYGKLIIADDFEMSDEEFLGS